jgi:hypothetical protein
MDAVIDFIVPCIGFIAGSFMNGFAVGRWYQLCKNEQFRETITQSWAATRK